MVKQDELRGVIEDLLMLRGELESMDVRAHGWEAALGQRQRRQERRDLEDALQERLAHLGALVLDAVQSGQSDTLMARLNDELLPSPSPAPREALAQPPALPSQPPVASTPTLAPVIVCPDFGVEEDEPQDERAEPDAPAHVDEHKTVRMPALHPPASLSAPASPRPEPTPPAASPREEVTEEMVARLRESLSGRQSALFFDGTHEDRSRRAIIQEVFEIAGKTPDKFRSKGNVRDEVRALASVILQTLSRWEYAGKHANADLTHWIVARARGVQDELTLHYPQRADDLETIRKQFPVLTRHVEKTDPGFIYGLAQRHEPREGASWLDDAHVHEARLRQWLGEHTLDEESAGFDLDDELRRLTEEVRRGLDPTSFVARLDALQAQGVRLEAELRVVRLAVDYLDALVDARHARLRRKIEEELDAVEHAAEDEAQDSSIPPDWPYFAHTRGQRAVLVGGDPRHHRVEKIRAAFGFESLEWIESGPRMISALTKKMRQGGVDLVLVLRGFCAHRVSGPIFELRRRDDGSGCEVILADAYGIQQLRLGIERFLQGERDEARSV